MEAVQWLRDGIQAYNKRVGLPPVVEGHNVPVDEERAGRIATEYVLLPSYDKQAELAYATLHLELLRQVRFIVSKLHIHLEAWEQPGEPYANSKAMQADIRDNKHLYYFTGGETHPMLGRKVNNIFRAVHDVFGHAAEGYGFGPRGEENAWLHHSQMFSPLAQEALTTETRGQNSWVNFGPYKHLPASERPFAEQKCALLPEWVTDWHLFF